MKELIESNSWAKICDISAGVIKKFSEEEYAEAIKYTICSSRKKGL